VTATTYAAHLNAASSHVDQEMMAQHPSAMATANAHLSGLRPLTSQNSLSRAFTNHRPFELTKEKAFQMSPACHRQFLSSFFGFFFNVTGMSPAAFSSLYSDDIKLKGFLMSPACHRQFLSSFIEFFRFFLFNVTGMSPKYNWQYRKSS
jgi:hypothetical protein